METSWLGFHKEARGKSGHGSSFLVWRMKMEEENKCGLFRQPEILSFGKGIGYCDMDGSSTACKGDANLCEKPDACLAATLPSKQSRNSPKRELPVSHFGSTGQRIW